MTEGTLMAHIDDVTYFIRRWGVADLLNDLKMTAPDEYQQLLLAALDAAQEESDALKVLRVAHYGDN